MYSKTTMVAKSQIKLKKISVNADIYKDLINQVCGAVVFLLTATPTPGK